MALKTASPAAPFEDLTWPDRGQINCNPGLCLARCSVPWDTPESQMTGASRPRRWQRDSLLPTLAQPRHGPKTCRSTDQPGKLSPGEFGTTNYGCCFPPWTVALTVPFASRAEISSPDFTREASFNSVPEESKTRA